MTENGAHLVPGDRDGSRPRRFGNRRLLFAAFALLLLLAIGLARHAPDVHTPSTATPGARIHVTAGDLRLGDYSLTLYGRDPSVPGRFCQTRIASAKYPLNAINFTARLPSRLPCFSESTATPVGFIPVIPGRYALIISAPRGTGFDSHLSYISRPLRIT